MVKLVEHKYLKNVVTLSLDVNQCIGCNMCINVCPHEVFTTSDKKVQIHNKDKCMECGACAKNCPVAAIDVKSGVGCAYAIIVGKITGREPDCGCSDEIDCC